MLQTILVPAMIVSASGLCVLLYCLDRVRRREALYRWASSNGYRILSFKQPMLTELSGFPVSASKAQQVFKVEVEDCGEKCVRRSGWVRLGDAWRGLSSGAAEVRWETC